MTDSKSFNLTIERSKSGRKSFADTVHRQARYIARMKMAPKMTMALLTDLRMTMKRTLMRTIVLIVA